MKLTTKQLKQIIKEELDEILSPELRAKLDSLFATGNPADARSGIELADIYGIPITTQMLSPFLKSSDPVTVIEGIEMAFENAIELKYSDLNQKTQVISAIVHSDIGKEDPEFLRLLSTSWSPWVLGMVLKNPNTPMDIITDSKWYTRPADRAKWSLARNPALPIKQMEMLANDVHPKIRKHITHNANVTTEILEKLINDPVDYVRRAALEKLK